VEQLRQSEQHLVLEFKRVFVAKPLEVEQGFHLPTLI